MPNEINWGILSPLNQISPIKTSSPVAQQAQSGPVGQPSSGPLDQTPIYNPINPLGTAGSVLSQLLGNDPGAITQRLGQDSKQSISDNLQKMNQLQNPQQLLQGPLGIDSIKQSVAQQFPNNPIMQQMAVAQAAQESGLLQGKPSDLAQKYNNIFGIKGSGSEGSANLMTKEYENGLPKNYKQPFARYKDINEATAAYKQLMQNPRYKGVLEAKTFEDAAKAMQASGYATDPHYADQLMQVNNQLSHLKTPAQAKEAPTPYIQGGAPIPQEMENTSAFHQAITTYAKAREDGTTKSPYVVSIDYSQPATAKRLSVINAETGKVVLQSEVAQGKEGFSNDPGSHQSSLGTFVTTETYDGKHGKSLKIRGLNPGLNDNVEKRDVVVHGADYIGKGKTGHSFGCFAVPSDVAPQLINLIKDGTIIQASAGTDNL